MLEDGDMPLLGRFSRTALGKAFPIETSQMQKYVIVIKKSTLNEIFKNGEKWRKTERRKDFNIKIEHKNISGSAHFM